MGESIKDVEVPDFINGEANTDIRKIFPNELIMFDEQPVKFCLGGSVVQGWIDVPVIVNIMPSQKGVMVVPLLEANEDKQLVPKTVRIYGKVEIKNIAEHIRETQSRIVTPAGIPFKAVK